MERDRSLSLSLSPHLSICHLLVSSLRRHTPRATRQVVMKHDTRRSPTMLPVHISCVRPHHCAASCAGQSPYPDEIYDAERNLSCRTTHSSLVQRTEHIGARPQLARFNEEYSPKRRSSHSLFAHMDILVELPYLCIYLLDNSCIQSTVPQTLAERNGHRTMDSSPLKQYNKIMRYNIAEHFINLYIAFMYSTARLDRKKVAAC